MSDFLHQLSYQHRRIKKHQEIWTVPVTIVCGFLGSGKTTTVNHIVSLPGSENFDVFIREYSLISIDDRLVELDRSRVHASSGVSEHVDEETMLFIGLDRLHEERFKRFDRLILETSGAEDPEIFEHLFFLWDMPEMYKLSRFITVLDCEYGDLNLDEFDSAVSQIAMADTVLLNKTDLVPEEKVNTLEARVRGINVAANVLRTQYGNISLDDIAEIGLYQQLSTIDPEKEVKHMDKIKSYTLEVNEPLDKSKVNTWINDLFQTHGTDILRSKGFLSFAGENYRYEFQAVRKTFHSYAHDVWKPDEERKTVLVLIGDRDKIPEQEELLNGLRNCIAG